jgi:hypothetical protein
MNDIVLIFVVIIFLISVYFGVGKITNFLSICIITEKKISTHVAHFNIACENSDLEKRVIEIAQDMQYNNVETYSFIIEHNINLILKNISEGGLCIGILSSEVKCPNSLQYKKIDNEKGQKSLQIIWCPEHITKLQYRFMENLFDRLELQ